MRGTRWFAAMVLGCLAAFSGTSAGAQSYPASNRVIRMVVPFPAGGATDVVARVVAERLGTQLGTRVIVENKGGAAGNIGAAEVAKAEGDGYTLLFSASGPLSANKTLYSNLPYDPDKDFEPISLVSMMPNIVVVNPNFPAKTAQEFIDYVKTRPGQIDYSSIGNGSSQHLAGVLFDQVAGTKMRHIPYRSSGQLIVELMAGDVPVSFQLIPNVVSQIKDGKIRAIGLMQKTRSPSLPDVPTFAEQGWPQLESTGWFGMLAPRGTPKEIVERLNAEVVKIVSEPAVRQRFIEVGADPATSTPGELKSLISAEIVKWRDLIVSAGVRPD